MLLRFLNRCACGRLAVHVMKSGRHVCVGCFYDVMRRILIPALPIDDAPRTDDDPNEYAGEDDERGPALATDGPRWGLER